MEGNIYEMLRLDNLSNSVKTPEKYISSMFHQMNIMSNYMKGLIKYSNSFLNPYLSSIKYFAEAEMRKLPYSTPVDSFYSLMGLFDFTMDITQKGLFSSYNAAYDYNKNEMNNAMEAFFNTIFSENSGEDIESYLAKQEYITSLLVNEFDTAIESAGEDFGFHFERNTNIKVAETDRFILYQILPTDKKIQVKKNGKPVLIIPPFVLGANILAFLPVENRSYAHAFANQGIPTYIRIMKDIKENLPVQLMKPEDDTNDTRIFCEKIKEKHGKLVTINGYCQGGFTTVCNVMTGELDGLVDAIITCVSPMDGTKSEGLANFLKTIPKRYNDLNYSSKILQNGVKVADGEIMSWVYKLKAIENEAPVTAFYRDMKMFVPRDKKQQIQNVQVNKSAAAINYWLRNERNDLPIAITEMSFSSYNTPVTDDGTLPVKIFGRKLNFNRIKEKGLKWLICYGESDDLVEKGAAIAPSQYIPVELSAFPRGHVAIATSWSSPDSKCALHKVFGENNRGPVKFQLDLDKELNKVKK